MSMQPSTSYQPTTTYGQEQSYAAPAYAAAAQAPQPPMRISNGPWALGSVGALASLIALFGAWYAVSINMGLVTGSIDFSIFGGCTISAMGLGMPCNMVAVGIPSVFGAMAPSLLLLLGALGLGLVGTAMGYTRRFDNRKAGLMLILSGALGIGACIALIPTIGPAVTNAFAAAGGSGPVPGGTTLGFMGSATVPGGFGASGTISWGPGGGWWTAMVAAVISLIAGFAARAAKPVPIVPAVPAYGAYPVYAQAPQAYGQAAGPSYGQAYGQSYASAPAQQATVNCRSCGTLNWATSASCGKCGASLTAAPAAAPVTAQVSAQVAAPAQQAATKTCPSCGTLNWATSAVCGKCGSSMSAQAAAAAAPAAAPAAQPATKNCPACGTLNWATSAVCGKCGAAMGP